MLALSQTELRKGRVVLFEELAGDLPPVTGDRVQLQQVILNLLLNASEAMSGAAECLFKPLGEAALLDALDAALRVR